MSWFSRNWRVAAICDLHLPPFGRGFLRYMGLSLRQGLGQPLRKCQMILQQLHHDLLLGLRFRLQGSQMTLLSRPAAGGPGHHAEGRWCYFETISSASGKTSWAAGGIARRGRKPALFPGGGGTGRPLFPAARSSVVRQARSRRLDLDKCRWNSPLTQRLTATKGGFPC